MLYLKSKGLQRKNILISVFNMRIMLVYSPWMIIFLKYVLHQHDGIISLNGVGVFGPI